MEEKEPEVLTFKKIGDYLKRSILRIVVYALIAMIVVSAVMGVYVAFGSDYEYQSSIIFNNKGIENGAGPWNSSLDISDGVRNSYVVSKALTSCGYSDEDVTRLTPEIIRRLAVTAQFDANAENADQLNAFAFRISITDGKSLGLGKTQTTQLLDAIVANYIADFRSAYSYATFNESADGMQSTEMNYLQIADELEYYVGMLQSMIDTMAQVNPTFRATEAKMTFPEMSAYLNGILNRITALRDYAMINGIESVAVDQNKSIGGASYIDSRVAELTQESARLDQISKDYQALVAEAAKHNPNISIGENGNYVINTSDPEFYKLLEQAAAASKDAADAKARLDKWSTYKSQNYYGEDSVFALAEQGQKDLMRQKADSMLAQILAGISADAASVGQEGAIVAKYNSAIREYNKLELLRNGVRVSSYAGVVSLAPIDFKVFVLVNAAAAVVAVMVAIGMTNAIRKKHALAAAKAGQAEDVQADATQDEPVQSDDVPTKE